MEVKTITIRCTPAKYDMIKKDAHKHFKDMSEYLRWLAEEEHKRMEEPNHEN